MIGVIRAEWLKLRSVRSNVALLGFVLVLGVGLGALLTGVIPDHARRGGGRGPLQSTFDRAGITLAGLNLAMLLIGVFGVHLVGQEYRFNTIRATFAAVPRRLQVLGAKLGVLIVTSAVVGLVAEGLAYLIGKSILSSRGYPIVTTAHAKVVNGQLYDLTAPTLHRILLGTFLLAIVFGIAGYGVGMIVRQPIGGIILVLAFPLVIENIVVGFLKSSAGKWMPYNAGSQLLSRTPDKDLFGPWAGFFYFLGFAVVLCIIGAVLSNHRDA
jgi:ABC-2 type transport system permease protein